MASATKCIVGVLQLVAALLLFYSYPWWSGFFTAGASGAFSSALRSWKP